MAADLDTSRVRVRFGDRSYAIRRAVIHPDWVELGPHDIGLLELAEPVVGHCPAGVFLP